MRKNSTMTRHNINKSEDQNLIALDAIAQNQIFEPHNEELATTNDSIGYDEDKMNININPD